MAGSILIFFRVSGIKVPTIPAITTFIIIAPRENHHCSNWGGFFTLGSIQAAQLTRAYLTTARFELGSVAFVKPGFETPSLSLGSDS
jgi:hypothetical protein